MYDLTRTGSLAFVGWLALVALLLGACPEDKKPPTDLGLDVPADMLSGGGDRRGDEERSCDGHSDCDTDELCDNEVCVDLSDVDLTCDDTNDCPNDFICVEEECERD